MRLFLALDVPNPIRKRLAAFIKELQATGAQVNWVPPKNLHYTIHFIGGTQTKDVPDVETISRKIGQQTEPFEVEVFGAGFFGSEKFVKIVWAGSRTGSQNLKALMERSGSAFPGKTEHEAAPHLTIGRLFGPAKKDALLAAIRANEARSFGTFQAKEMTLRQSQFPGPVYQDVQTFRFA